jgi:hypothetical protein
MIGLRDQVRRLDIDQWLFDSDEVREVALTDLVVEEGRTPAKGLDASARSVL